MKYENARNILPARLLEEVQKYADGKVIYIPKKGKSMGWGEASGYRDKLNKRNALICSSYSAGKSVMAIAEEFYLTPETVKKLVYGKKINLPIFSPSIASAGQYAVAGMGEEWVRTYLNLLQMTPPDISHYFMTELVRIPLRLIETDDCLNTVEGIEDFMDIPLIVMYEKRTFSAPYQQKYLNYLKKEKRNSYYAFVYAQNDEYGYFQDNYGKHFQR